MRIAVLDIGGTSIKSGLYEQGELKALREYPTDAKRGGAYVLERACGLLAEHAPFDAIGISTAGQVNPLEGSIIYANENIPNYTGMQLASRLRERFGVPVAVENDVNAAALGEARFGAGRDCAYFVMATYGTGVGGAAVLNGELYHGSGFSAAEFGGIVVHPEEVRAGEVFSGCYERYASATALVRRVCARFPQLDNGRKIFASLNEPQVRALVDAWIDEVMYGLITLTHIFNPDKLILGGGVMAQSYVLEQLTERLGAHLSGGFAGTLLCAASLQNSAGLYGAAALAEALCQKG